MEGDTSNPFYMTQLLLRHPNDAEGHQECRQVLQYHHHVLHHQNTPSPIPSGSDYPSSIFEPPDPSSPPPFYDRRHAEPLVPYTPTILSPLTPVSESEVETDSDPDYVPDAHTDDYFGCDYEDDVEVSFVTNLFERRIEVQNPDLVLGVGSSLGLYQNYEDEDMDDSRKIDCGSFVEGDESNKLDLELGLGLEVDQESNRQREIEEPGRFDGLRVVSIDSESDSGESDKSQHSGTDDFDGNDRLGRINDFDRPPFCWDYLGFNNTDIETEWEEAADDEREIEISSIHFDTDDEREFEDGLEDAIEDLEWDAIFVEAAEDNLHQFTGNPPAAKSVLENLPVVDLCCGDLVDKEIVCAICKDEISAEEEARQLPCCHSYHGDCILPWLRIRNTCPLCRYELPTDDAEYEFSRREWIAENTGGSPSDLATGDDFHLFCWWIVTRLRDFPAI
ncbi:hypothetical protein Nepgr_022464 [Nepenthes gracilis]|uniref:RING-type E3 ubiquitin transferase n=1 Tax=Nepenthes gracilis TaxID=150966 RepID=A0AAD3XX14_NEPGR|nr:hypothetical protein Nepgr_022464 [Nepenthes gracilis]